jgi:hypothetical protein
MGWFTSPAKRAGHKAGESWLHILDQTNEETETLTGLDLYNYAKEEARNWLRSHHKIDDRWPDRQIFAYPEQRYHGQFTEYIEAFVSAFPPRTQGYPKADSHFDYLEEELS